MPYKLSGTSVVRADTGAVVKKHPTREKALAHLRALKANVEEGRRSSVLGSLLEGFAAQQERAPSWHGKFVPGDRVRVPVKGGKSIVGRLVRPAGDPEQKVVVAPEGGGAHVEAHVSEIRLDTPAQHAQAARRAAQAALRAPGPGVPGERVQAVARSLGPGQGAIPTVRGGRTTDRVGAGGRVPGRRVMEALREGFDPLERRGFHGRWIRGARKSPNAQKEASEYQSVLAGARAKPARPLDAVVNFGGVPTSKGEVIRTLQGEGHPQAHIDRYLKGLERQSAGLAVSPDIPPAGDRHDGFKVGDHVRYQQNYGVGMESGEVVRLSRNGNLTVRGANGTTVDVHHSKARISALHPATRTDAALEQKRRDRAQIEREKAARAVRPAGGSEAQRAVQAQVEAQQMLDAIIYGQRTLAVAQGKKDVRGRDIPSYLMRSTTFGAAEPVTPGLSPGGPWSGAQWSAALDAAAKLGISITPNMGDAVHGYSDRRRAEQQLRDAKKQATERLNAAKKRVKAIGGRKQLRLALNEALRRYGEEAIAATFGAGMLAEAREPAWRMLLGEAFSTGPAPKETAAQSMAIGARQQAAAKAAVASGAFNPSKHPRGGGGKFRYTTGGKRAHVSRSSSHSSHSSSSLSTAGYGNYLRVGTHGALIKAIQRQLGIKADGIYGQQTHAAITRFQTNHGLKVDGVVGAQTIAALRGNTKAKTIKPGPLPTRTARVVRPRSSSTRRSSSSSSSSRRRTVKAKQPVGFGGGVRIG